MKVLLLASCDWTALGYKYSLALRRIGVDATCIIAKKHPYNYPEEGLLTRDPAVVKKYAEEADVIHFMHTSMRSTFTNISKKIVIMSHTGSAYRYYHEVCDEKFNHRVDACIVGPEMYDICNAKNKKYMAMNLIDTDKIQPDFNRYGGDKLIIGHYPSKQGNKGTGAVKLLIKNLQNNNFVFKNSGKVPWPEQMKRVSECDIYIEKFRPIHGGKNCAAFGTAAFEAAALGDIVVTNMGFRHLYKKYIGDLDIITSDDFEEMTKKVDELLSLSDKEIRNIKEKHREWVVRCHSFKAVGKRLLDVYESIKK